MYYEKIIYLLFLGRAFIRGGHSRETKVSQEFRSISHTRTRCKPLKKYAKLKLTGARDVRVTSRDALTWSRRASRRRCDGAGSDTLAITYREQERRAPGLRRMCKSHHARKSITRSLG